MVPALRQHRDIGDDLDPALGIGSKRCLALGIAHLAVNRGSRDAVGAERRGNILRMLDGRAEHHRLPLARLILPVADDLVRHRRLVHDLGDGIHVEVGGDAADLLQRLLDTHVDDEGARLHQMTGSDEFRDADLICDIVEHIPQALAVAPVGCRGDAEHLGRRIELQGAVDDSAVAVCHRMVRLIDYEEIELRHAVEVGRPRQGRDHGEGSLAFPRLLVGVDHGGGDGRVDAPELGAVLLRQFVAVSDDADLCRGLADDVACNGGEQNRLATSGWADSKRVVVGVKRSKAALDKEFLAGAKHHDDGLTSPRWDARHRTAPEPAQTGVGDRQAAALAARRNLPAAGVLRVHKHAAGSGRHRQAVQANSPRAPSCRP